MPVCNTALGLNIGAKEHTEQYLYKLKKKHMGLAVALNESQN